MPLQTNIHGGSMKSKPNFVFHISTSNMKTVFNTFVKKLSVVWSDYLIKADGQNVLHLLVCKPGGAGAIGQQHRRLTSYPDHPTLPTSVASDRLHHGLLSGRLDPELPILTLS